MVAPDASDVILQLLKQVPGLPQKRGNIPPQGDGFAGVVARLLVPVRLACGRTTTSSMMTADLPAGDGRRLAWLACPLRSGVASRGFEGGWRIAHGVVSSFFGPPPPAVTVPPTMAWPPSDTVTCWTVTFCSPVLRYRFRASRCGRCGTQLLPIYVLLELAQYSSLNLLYGAVK